MRPDQSPALDLAAQAGVAHASGGGFEVGDFADSVEVDLRKILARVPRM